MRRSLATALTLGLALLGPACPRPATSPPAPPPGGAQDAEPVVSVETAEVRRAAILRTISAPGSLMPRRVSRLGPEVGGRIARVYVEEGDRVATGDPLFQIDPEPYALALGQATARLDRAQAERAQIEADLARGRELRSREVLAQQEMDQLGTRLQVAGAAEREAEEAVALARRNMEQTTVRAPYDASVAARLEDEGTTALVQPQTIVVVLHETAELEAEAAIPEVHLSAVRVGDPAVLHVEGLARPIETRVSAVSDAIDPATRTYVVKMRIANPERRLKAGVFARVEISPRAKGDVLVAPAEAIRREEGRTRVLVVRDGRAVAVPVRIGAIGQESVEILDGLDAGEEVVVGEAARTLGPGMRVEPSPARVGPAS